MKKFTLFLAGLAMATILFGQISVGFTIGSNLCKIKQDLDYSSFPDLKPDEHVISTAVGFIVGIPLEIGISERLGLFTLFSYYQKGAKIRSLLDSPDNYLKSDGTTIFNYLELPIQAKYYILKKDLKVFALFGPSFGYAISARAKYDLYSDYYDGNGIIHENYNEKLNAKDMADAGFKRMDISLSLGAGLSYTLWKGEIYLNVNYTYGLIDMIQEIPENTYDIKQYHRGINTMVGFLVPLTK